MPATLTTSPSITFTPAVSPLCERALAATPARDVVVTAAARRWIALAIGSLVVAGLLSLAVVVGRLPVISSLISDPLFFKRCLVVHVNLALVVWFYAFIAGLSAMRTSGDPGILGRAAFGLSVVGVGAMLAGASAHGAQPILANFVPVIDHPLFLGGLAAFFLGALVFLLEALRSPTAVARNGLPADAGAGIQATTIACVLAGATWLATRASLPAGLDRWTYFEFSAWGAGHVLQVANTAAMLSVWLWLVARATGRSVLTPGQARLLFTLLIAPHFAMPLLTARGALDSLYHSGATQLMRWGIFPVVLTALVLGVRHLRSSRENTEPLAPVARAGFAASATLALLGIALGACIRSSTTLVPAHYHASLGSVTVAFMTAAYLICAAVRAEHSATPAAFPAASARRQLILFGIGQSIFALGFAIGGAYGLGRKAYASEQHVRSLGEYVGLGVMGIGGLVATTAGLWFLYLVLREIRGWFRRHAATSLELLPSSP